MPLPYTVQFRRKPVSITFPYSTTPDAPPQNIIPANRLTVWQPGVTYNAIPAVGVAGNTAPSNYNQAGYGIPVRSTISATLSPISPPPPGSTVTISIGSPASISMTNTFVGGEQFIFQTTGLLPTDLATGTALKTNSLYFVLPTGLSGSSFRFASSSGGAAINTSGSQSGTQSIIVDDTPQINTAMANCPPHQVVKLTLGVFNLLTNVRYVPNASRGNTGGGDITLRGSGRGAGLSTGLSPVLGPGVFVVDATATQLYYGNQTLGFGPPVTMNGADTVSTFNSIINLAQDAIQGSYSCQLVSNAALVPGQLVRIDQYCSQPSVATVAAAGTWTTSSTTIPMSSSNPGGAVLPGMQVYDTTAGEIGYVLSYLGTTLTLMAPAENASHGATDSLVFSTYPYQSNDPDVWWGPDHSGPGSSTRAFFNRGDRPLAEIKEVATYNSSTFVATFTTPFRHNMCAGTGSSSSPYWPGKFVIGGQAQLCTFGTNAFIWGMGLEDMQISFGLAGGNGNIAFGGIAYGWIKNVESYWNNGASLLMSSCFRSEVRDCYLHESADPTPGGAGYLMDLQWGGSDCLVENCIFWNGNKEIVGQATGGGNVIAYNYMDDAFGAGAPSLPEAGVNCSHMIGSHMELMEGNYSQNYAGDNYWGNIVDHTIFRNWLSGLRCAAPPLKAYTTSGGQPYVDAARNLINIGAGVYRQNVVGNVIGYNGQGFIVVPGWSNQNAFAYEQLDGLGTDQTINMYYMGVLQDDPAGGLALWVKGSYLTHLRQGNWDWFTQTQKWHGIGGSVEYGNNPSPPFPTIPNSMYLTAKPAFWGATPWPWVDPSTGTTYTLPAKAAFEALTGISPIPPGNATL